MTRAAFRAFVRDPKSTPHLQALVADNARVDALLAAEVEERRIAEKNERIVLAHVSATLRGGEA